MTRRPYEVQKGIAGWSTALPVNDEGNATLTLDDALAGVFECVTATSSPAGTVEGKTAGGVWTQIESYQYTSGTYTRRAAGATVTLATGDLLYVPAPGFTHVRFKRASGTSMTWTARTLENLDQIFMIRQLVSGLAVTTTPPAIQCYSFIPDGTDELLIDATARKLWGVDVFTIDATPVYVKLYDKATAASEADTPIHRTGVPANATSTLGAGNNKGPWPVYIALTNGLSVRVVTGIADNSDAAVTTAENYVNVYWST